MPSRRRRSRRTRATKPRTATGSASVSSDAEIMFAVGAPCQTDPVICCLAAAVLKFKGRNTTVTGSPGADGVTGIERQRPAADGRVGDLLAEED